MACTLAFTRGVLKCVPGPLPMGRRSCHECTCLLAPSNTQSINIESHLLACRSLTTIASLSYASASVLSRSSSNNQQRAAGAAREQLPGAEALEAAKQLSASNQHTAAAAACGEEAGRKMHAELGKIALALHVGSGLDHGEWGSDGNWCKCAPNVYQL